MRTYAMLALKLIALTLLVVRPAMKIVHIIPNPIMEPSVRLSHFVEAASSNFLFGLVVAGLLLYQPRPVPLPLTGTTA